MPRVLPGPAAELNATDEKSKNEKSRENAEANFTSPRRNYCTAQRLCDHSPKKDEPRFDSFQHFAFETVPRLIAPRLSDSRIKGRTANRNSWVRLSSYPVDHSVHRSPCALYGTMRDVLRGNRRVFRHVPRRADRPSLSALNAANAKAEREKY